MYLQMENADLKNLALSGSEDFYGTDLLSWLDENSGLLVEREFKLIGKIYKFSDEQTHSSAYVSIHGDQLERNESFLFDYEMHLTANDFPQNDRGCVSIILKLYFPYTKLVPFILSCVVCAIDNSSRERYHRSYLRYCLQHERKRTIVIVLDNFIARETLLREPDELLPDDCLKLQIACNLQVTSDFPLIRPSEDYHYDEWISSFETFAGEKILLLDSKVAKVLRETSDWFRAVHRSEMLEKKQRYTSIPAQDFHTLLLLCKILMGDKVIVIISFKDFYKMLILADYYNIGVICAACRIILKCFLCSKSARVTEMAGKELDVSSYPEGKREILENFIKSSREMFSEVELQHRVASFTDIEINDLKYTCEVSGIHPIVTLKLAESTRFEFSKRDDFDFYH